MLDNLSALMSVTLGGSVCILLFLAAGPLLSKQFTPRWRYCAWGVLAAVLILFQPFHAMLPKPEDWSGLIQLSIPQAVSENAYDRENARNRDWEEIQKTGNGGRGAETENQDGERLRHSVQYENEAGEMVVIEDNDYVRKVTVGDETTYTVHWTGVAYGAYQAVAFLSVGFVLGRYFWTRRNLLRVSSPAGEEDQMALEQPEGGTFLAFVLLEQPEWDGEQFKRDLRDLWGIPCFTQETGGEDGEGALVFEADGMTAAVHLYPFPVPHGEAEENAAHNYLWPEAQEAARRHRGQLLISVLAGILIAALSRIGFLLTTLYKCICLSTLKGLEALIPGKLCKKAIAPFGKLCRIKEL